MTYNHEIHHRRSIRLKDYDYSQTGPYFVTVCAWKKECLFGEIKNGEMFLNEYGEIVMRCWNDLPNHYQYTQLDEFVIMPNHIHGIVVINSANVGAIHELPLRDRPSIEYRENRRQMLLPKIIGRFKMNAAKCINHIRNASGIPLWQRNYYEHIIRDDRELGTIRQYIRYNPLKWDEDEENPSELIPSYAKTY